MREYVRSQYIEQFRRYEEWFNTGAIPQEYASGLRVAEDSIVSYGDYLYHKGENLEHYLTGLGLSDQNPYPIQTCAYVDADGWRDNGRRTRRRKPPLKADSAANKRKERVNDVFESYD